MKIMSRSFRRCAALEANCEQYAGRFQRYKSRKMGLQRIYLVHRPHGADFPAKEHRSRRLY